MSSTRNAMRPYVAGLYLLIAAVLAAACSSSAAPGSSASSSNSNPSGDIKINVGLSHPLTFPAGTKPKIAFFASLGNTYEQVYQKSVQAAAKKYGIDVTYFDADFDATTQLTQLENALQSKRFNAWIVESYGPTDCAILTKQAPAEGIVVSQLNNTGCTPVGKSGEDVNWSPGTFNTIGQTVPSYIVGWVRAGLKIAGPGKHEVLDLNGPQGVPATTETIKALQAQGADVVATEYTDYTTPTGLTDTENALRAHRGIDVVFSEASDLTVGAEKAVAALGLAGKVKIIDYGGSTQVVSLIKAGQVTLSVPLCPQSMPARAIASIVAAFSGHQGPHYVSGVSPGTTEQPFAVTGANVAEFTPQY